MNKKFWQRRDLGDATLWPGSILFRTAAAFFLAITASSGRAGDTVPPPRPPFVQPLPNRADWTMTRQDQSSDEGEISATAPPRLRQIRVTKYEGNRREIQVWSNGRTTERWHVGRMLLFEQLDLAGICILRGNEAAGSNADFPGLSWLSLQTYQGVRNWEKQPCYYFRRETAPPAVNLPGVQISASPVLEEVWIAIKTGRPVAWKNGGQTWVYSFRDAPPAALVLPEAFRMALQNYQEALAKPQRHRMKL